MATLFSKIIKGEIPCYKVAENEKCFAFLDINPLTKGHTLVIPKKEVDYIFDLNDEDYQDLLAFAKEIAVAIKKSFCCVKVGMAVIGLDVNHAHVHLVPLNSSKDMDFSKEKAKLSPEEFIQIAEKIKSNL
ncbi:MAG: HIT family protein [Bacteroidales bacterium]|nr:HIT family protein [Bacteroidales bacterium]